MQLSSWGRHLLTCSSMKGLVRRSNLSSMGAVKLALTACASWRPIAKACEALKAERGLVLGMQ